MRSSVRTASGSERINSQPGRHEAQSRSFIRSGSKGFRSLPLAVRTRARHKSFSNCKECHGEKGAGGPVKLEDGTKLKVPSLREGHALHHPDSDFLKQITKGGDGMPAFKDKLKPEEIDDLVRFIRHEFQADMNPPAESAKPPKGTK